jgi:two-component system, LytTR family, response regulator
MNAGGEPLRVAVVDDEAPARERLRTLLAEDAELALVAECDGGRAAIDALTRERVDLVLLDIQMPELDGFDVIEAVGAERMPLVVFVTAYDEHAVRAFEVRALDYLLKPFDRARFAQALGRAKAACRGGGGPQASALGQMMTERQSRPLPRILVKDGDRIHVVKTSELDWMEAAGNYVELHAGKRVHLLRSTLAALEARLDPEVFVRIHRDTIVHIDRVRDIHRWQGGQYRVVLADGTERPIGRNYQARLEEKLGKV